MRVLYAAHEATLTGASQSLLDLLSGLDRRRVEPTVLLPNKGPLEETLARAGIPYTVIRSTKEFKSRSVAKTALKQSLSPFLQRRVERFVRDGGFDLVHCNSLLCLSGARAARAIGVPYICHVREFVQEDHGMAFIDEEEVRCVLRDAAVLVFISKAIATKFRPWAPEVESITIFNAVDKERFYVNHPLLFSGDRTCRLLLAGRFSSGKGQLDAIRAIEILSTRRQDVRLLLVGGIGDEDYFESCRKYVEMHGLDGRVEFLEFTEDLATLRAEADIALVCSKSEALGRVTIEGMMAGCLVIGADAGATPELIRDKETGLLYKASDPLSLADRIDWAISNAREARDIAARGQEWAMGPVFDKDVYAMRMTNIYEEVLNGCV